MNNKVYKKIEELSEEFKRCFGDLDKSFIMLVWGASANGKSSFIMKLIKELNPAGPILYISLEEGLTLSLQNNIKRSFTEEDVAHLNLTFTDHSTTYEKLIEYLQGKRRQRIIIIDSLQYWQIDYRKYAHLKELFPTKSFIFISHANGTTPDGKTADKIRYDAGIKVRVEGFIAFVASRYGGNKNYLIWEEGAKKYWGLKEYKKHLQK